MKNIKIILFCFVLAAFIYSTYRDFSTPDHLSPFSTPDHLSPYILHFTITNPNFYPIKFFSIQTPFDIHCQFMRVTFGKETIPYGGPLFSLKPPFDDLMMTLAPFQSRTVSFNVGTFYNMTRVGTYIVQYNFLNGQGIPSILQGATGKGDDEPTLWGVLAYFFSRFSMERHVAASNSIEVIITEDDIPAYHGYRPSSGKEFLKEDLS